MRVFPKTTYKVTFSRATFPPPRRGIPATLQSVFHAGTVGEEQSVATHKLPFGVTQEVRHSPGSGRWDWTVQGRFVIFRLGRNVATFTGSRFFSAKEFKDAEVPLNG